MSASIGDMMRDEDRELLESFRQEIYRAAEKPGKKFRRINPHIANFKVGDSFTGKVTGIEHYGVFLEDPVTGVSGLIHSTNMVEGKCSFNDIDHRRHFRMGDEVTAKVHEIRDGRLSLSTVGVQLPVYEVTATGGVTKREESQNRISEEASELEVLLEEMRTKVGAVSTKANIRIRELMNKYGIVRLSMALVKAMESFEPVDQSMLLVEEIEKHAGVKSPRRTFILTTHAKERWEQRGDGTDLMANLLAARLMFEDEIGQRRLYGDGKFMYPCAITEKGENLVTTVQNWVSG